MLDFSNYSVDSKYYDDSNRLVVGKMKYKTGGVAETRCVTIKEFVGLYPKMTKIKWQLYQKFLVDDIREHKKEKSILKKCCCNIKSYWIQRCFVELKIFGTYPG